MICRITPTLILLIAVPAFTQEPKSLELTPEEQKLAAEAVKLDGQVVQLYQQGRAAEAIGKARDSLEIRQKLYPKSKYPDGHADLALSINNLGFILQASGSYEKALPYWVQALEMKRRLFPESKYPDGHPDLALSINNLGFVLRAMGSYEKALPYYEQALAMYRKLYPASKYPDGHPSLALGINNLGFLLQAMGSDEKGLLYFDEALAMCRELYPVSKYPNGHPDLARSLNNLGFLLKAMGSYEKALPFFEQALAMKRNLYPASKYPDGHPDVALSINNLAALLAAIRLYDKALPQFEEALSMRRKLYPESKYPAGHPDLAFSINNLGGLLEVMGTYEKAVSRHDEALAMRRKLFPQSKYAAGHPDIALSLNNLGTSLRAMGRYEKALHNFEEALTMYRELYPPTRYPDGHPDLARCIYNMGTLLQAMGSCKKGLPYLEEAVTIYRKHGEKLLATASEAEALAFMNAQPSTRDGFLSLTTHLPDSSASAYRSVWDSKSALTRVLEQRHAAARAAGTEYAAKLDELKGLRRRIDQLLQDRRLTPAERDALLTQATDNRDKLESELAKALPMLQRGKELAALGPEELTSLVPEHSVLIDFVRYTRSDYDSAKPGKAGDTHTICYAAFVLAHGEPIRRIDVPEAEKIDQAVVEWRTAIEARVASSATKVLHDLVWAKLSPLLPSGTKTLYLSPDGNLARLPWAALPIGENRVLLEDYAIAIVPHGPFLLEHLKYPQPASSKGSVLALGDVAYNSKNWPNLPGTAIELKSLAFRSPITLTGTDAVSTRLLAELPKARYAHFATHGFFDAETLAAEKKRQAAALKNHKFGDDSRLVAGKNPLAFTGLVLAGGEVLSGLKLVDLPLENLKLITLSACETGLGDLTEGEGVYGLTRAFHLAGCPNVVASLWKVNDAATAALMAKFYHELWTNKRSAIEALREAQLMVYRRPDLIPDLSGARGRPSLENAVKLKSVDRIRKAVSSKKTTDTKLWAAFVLSGVGK